jgi:hypothetical protein
MEAHMNIARNLTTVSATLALCAIALGGALVTSTASATAIGAEPVGGFEMDTPAGVTVRVPECQLNHEIHGGGKKITHQIAYLGCAVPQVSLCNWRIDFHYADTNGTTYKIDKGKTHHSCDLSAKREVKTNHTLKHYGKACAHLVVNGKRCGVQCHNITA